MVSRTDLLFPAPNLAVATGAGKFWHLLILAGALTACLAILLLRSTNPDVSWLLTLNDQMLAGAIPYRDMIEANPPASILLYTPVALASKWLGVRAELALAFELTTLAGVVLWSLRRNSLPVLTMAALVACVLPMAEIAQREHFAVLFMLPYAFLMVARASGTGVTRKHAVLCGLMLGLAVSIKPYFALCPLFASTFVLVRTASVRVFFRGENWAAALVLLAYLGVCATLFPAFFTDTVPLVADLYLPVRNDPDVLLARIVPAITLPLAICWLYRKNPRREGVMVLLLIAAGFLGAYWVQGKGWDNHAYPVIGFCLIAAALAASSGAPRWPGLPGWLGPATLGLALVLAAPRYWKADSGRPALAAAIQQIHSHPKMLVLGLPISLGHPLVRDIGGSYAGSVASLWITPGALLMKERAGDDSALVARAGAWFEKDRLLAVRDIEIKKPDIVLVQIHPDFDFPAWIAASAPLQAAMSHYQWIGIVDGAQIFSRR